METSFGGKKNLVSLLLLSTSFLTGRGASIQTLQDMEKKGIAIMKFKSGRSYVRVHLME